jgi:hypothetical protein
MRGARAFLLRAGDAFAGRPCTWRTREVAWPAIDKLR